MTSIHPNIRLEICLTVVHSEVRVTAADRHIPVRERRIDSNRPYSCGGSLCARGGCIDAEAFFAEKRLPEPGS
jgi:hypothetical protein